ncbi:permease [Actinomycetospora lemnae]|uniref:Permease n=1 Tax=Actinomycetospora lemnae TaxID=3019891 RepID=A0ABT5SWE0_9PSEU|nr:permease [Actinomycetospora sp. DW7H6]MDD7967104.1 permease [Actinomycetospora sp. DW7H6]
MSAPRPTDTPPATWRGSGSLVVLCGALLAATALQGPLVGLLDVGVVRTAATVFVAVCVQALPFLVLGTLLSGAIAAWVSPAVLRRVLPTRPALAVPVAGAAGLVLPGCECASVPVARRLVAQGVPEAAALAFLLAAPAINPVVLVATAVAFPDHPEMVLARLLGSAATAVGVGWLWSRFGRAEWIAARVRRPPPDDGTPRWAVFAETVRHDVVDAGGFLVLGGLAAAVMTVVVPQSWLDGLAGHLVLAVAVMAVLAVLLALCSEADAFVAASLSALPLLPRLVFLVVGPAVDVKLVALQAGAFGRAFAARFAPLTFVVAVTSALVAGLLVLGGPR